MIQSSFQERKTARLDKLEVERKRGKLKSTIKPQLEGDMADRWRRKPAYIAEETGSRRQIGTCYVTAPPPVIKHKTEKHRAKP